jgi:hypothetical protein
VFRWNLENATNVLEEVQRHRGLAGVLTTGWPQVGVDLIKRVIRDSWLSFRGDDLGWPWFDQCQQCLTRLIRSLALMRLIKDLGHHTSSVLSWFLQHHHVVGNNHSMIRVKLNSSEIHLMNMLHYHYFTTCSAIKNQCAPFDELHILFLFN